MEFGFVILLSLYITNILATDQVGQGPFEVSRFEAQEYYKSDIAEGLEGVPVQYLITVQRNCTPVEGIRMDTWLSDAKGRYSGIPADKAAQYGYPETLELDFQRGWQLTDCNGQVAFNSIYPAAYAIRTNHIHFRIREWRHSKLKYNETTQMFFPQDLNEAIADLDIYKNTNPNYTRITNEYDFYAVSVDANMMKLEGSIEDGFVATYTIELRDPTANVNLMSIVNLMSTLCIKLSSSSKYVDKEILRMLVCNL